MDTIPFSKAQEILNTLAEQAKNISIKDMFKPDTITAGFEIYRMPVQMAEELYGVKPNHVRIELVCVHSEGNPHIHRFAEAGFLFLGPAYGFPASKAYLLLGEWNQKDESVLCLYNITQGLVAKVPPLLVHGFAVAEGPLWFLGVHSPLIHENNDLEVVAYKRAELPPKDYILK